MSQWFKLQLCKASRAPLRTARRDPLRTELGIASENCYVWPLNKTKQIDIVSEGKERLLVALDVRATRSRPDSFLNGRRWEVSSSQDAME